jgi:hypothetical protein
MSFASQVVVAGKALRLLEANGIQVNGGHIAGQSVMFVIRVEAFDLLAARGELVEMKLGRAQPTDEISFHATIIHEACLALLPDVRVMSVVIQPLRDVAPALTAITVEAIVEPPAPGTPAFEEGLVEAWGPFDEDKKVTAEPDPDQWPVPFGS